MDSNREEALKALKIAQSNVDADPNKALRFARKACGLYWSPEAAAIVRQLENGEGSSASASKAAPGTSAGMNGTANGSATGAHPKPGSSAGEGLRNRASASTAAGSGAAPVPEKKREWTPKQAEVVKRVRKCKVTEYYEILELKRDCEEVHVKSAYRKLALALHPDKNGAPGADEAFKMVSKAFQVLSDGDKRAAFDRHGADPDSRSAGMSSFSRGGGGMSPGFRTADDGGIDPEELFRAFFGGGPGMAFGGGPFGGGGGVYTFNLGGGGGNRFQRQRAGGAGGGGAAQPQASVWLQILPLLFLFGLSLVSSLPSLFNWGFGGPQDPNFSWTRSQIYPLARTTLGSVGVTYHVNPNQFATHPMYADFLKANPSLGFQPPNEDPKSRPYLDSLVSFLTTVEAPKLRAVTSNPASKAAVKVTQGLRRFEQGIENAWVRRLQVDCQDGLAHKEDRKRRAMGFFGVMADWDEIRRIEAEKVESCDRLRQLGYSTQYYG